MMCRYQKKLVLAMVLVLLLIHALFIHLAYDFFSETPATAHEDLNYSRANVFQSRRNHLIETCTREGRTPPTDFLHSTVLKTMLLETTHNIIYCPVEKVASTFWRRTLTAIKSQGRYTSPFNVKLNSPKYKLNNLYQLIKANQSYTSKRFLRNATSLIVVRDPYTKLFSGYADKLFHPNPLFWETLGVPIKQILRNYTHPNSSLICGNDVTFAEFIKYIILANSHNMKINGHFTSISSHCDPCSMKYDYISKIETFKDDVFHIMKDWHQRFNVTIQFSNFYKETAMSIAQTHIRLSFRTKNMFSLKCNIKDYNFLLRTWRFLQMSGLIPKEIDIPFEDTSEAHLVTVDTFTSAVESVLAGNISWPDVKKQRQEALLQAYQTISAEDMEKLRELVMEDCLYFQYDDRPEQLFHKNDKSTVTSDFNYFDGLQ